MATQNTNKISWQAPEFRHYEKNIGWYVTLLGIAVLVVAFFIIQQDIFAAVTMAILSLLIVLFSRHKPGLINIELSSKGAHLGGLFYPYKQIKHFWIVDNQNHKTVNLETTAYLNNLIILELEEQDPDKVRNFLRQHLPEHENTNETVAQKVMHRFKF
jgi:hypothetical protein